MEVWIFSTQLDIFYKKVIPETKSAIAEIQGGIS